MTIIGTGAGAGAGAGADLVFSAGDCYWVFGGGSYCVFGGACEVFGCYFLC